MREWSQKQKISSASSLSLVSSLILVCLSAPSSCLKAPRSTPFAFSFISAFDRISTMSIASSTSANACACSDLKNCSQAARSLSPKQRCRRGSRRSGSLMSCRWCSRNVIRRPSRFSMFSSALRISVEKASSSHSNAQFRNTFNVASRNFSSKLTTQGMKRTQILSSTRNLRPRSMVAKLTKMPPMIQRRAISRSRRAQRTSTMQPRLSPSPITLPITSSSFDMLSSSNRASSSSRPLHSLSFTPSGSTSARYSGTNSASAAKWMSVERLMVVSLGAKTYLRSRGTMAAGENMRRAWEVGVYWRMALMVPCCTSTLELPSSSVRSPTSSAVSAAPSTSASAYCRFSINNYKQSHFPALVRGLVRLQQGVRQGA